METCGPFVLTTTCEINSPAKSIVSRCPDRSFGNYFSCAPQPYLFVHVAKQSRCKKQRSDDSKLHRGSDVIRPVSAELDSRSLCGSVGSALLPAPQNEVVQTYGDMCDTLRFTRCTVWGLGYLFCSVKVSRLGTYKDLCLTV
ncbi:hypothetical protein BDR03DRAFT_990305 [Suillus americanus]|nr:hypothetical protein BDR03DRAFT_990305 [Suillus americanus]